MIDRQLPQRWLLVLLIFCSTLFALGPIPLYAQQGDAEPEHHRAAMVGHDHHASIPIADRWEGSVAGIAYSERNHHIAGWSVVLMGLAELTHAMRLPSIAWPRLFLPAAMLFSGFFVMIWSDHEAWPIGSLSVTETFLGRDAEIVQHKIYGLLALVVGSIELFRRIGRLGHLAWVTPLPLLAIVGGVMLFVHSHGIHPSAHKIAMHHAVMGTMAVTAGSSKFLSGWLSTESREPSFRWELLWAWLIFFIGLQLLIYSE